MHKSTRMAQNKERKKEVGWNIQLIFVAGEQIETCLWTCFIILLIWLMHLN